MSLRLTGAQKANDNDEGIKSRVAALQGRRGSVEDGPINRGLPVDEWLL